MSSNSIRLLFFEMSFIIKNGILCDNDPDNITFLLLQKLKTKIKN